LEVEPATEGRQRVTVDVAFENSTDEFSVKDFETDGSCITTEGGAAFPVTGVGATSGKMSELAEFTAGTAIGVPFALPPGFRARGLRSVEMGYGFVREVADGPCQLVAYVADDARRTKLTIPKYGELDLAGQIGDPAFPGEAKGIPIYEVGEGAEVPGKATSTLIRVTREPMEVSGDFGEFNEVRPELSYGNLTDSYDDTFAVHLSLIGDDGPFYRLWSPAGGLNGVFDTGF
jgi:hypothetical protein